MNKKVISAVMAISMLSLTGCSTEEVTLYSNTAKSFIESAANTINGMTNSISNIQKEIDAINQKLGSSSAPATTTPTTTEPTQPTTQPTTPTTPTGALNVKDFGAAGDGIADDTSAIKNALSSMQAGQTLYMPSGTYKISSTLYIPSGVSIIGDGMDLTIISQDYAVSTTMLNISGKSHITISKLKLLGNASKKTVTIRPEGVCGIAANKGASYNTISYVQFEDLGRYPVNPDDPDGDVNNLSSNLVGVAINIYTDDKEVGNAEGNVIENNRFIDKDLRCGFGIRIFTDWHTTTLPEQLKNKAINNIVRNNYFEGYTFNVLEIAGPATEHNLIEKNISINAATLSGIEADKGAHHNEFTDNTVKDMKPLAADQSAFRDQGLDPVPASGYPAMHSHDNVWTNNKAINLTEHKSDASAYGAMLLTKSDNTVIINFIVDTINPASPDKATTAAIAASSKCSNITVDNLMANNVPVAFYGVGVDTLKISNSTANVSLGFYKSAGTDLNVSLINNKINGVTYANGQ